MEELKGHTTQAEVEVQAIRKSVIEHKSCIHTLEQTHERHTSKLQTMQLKIEDGENRCRKNNRGILGTVSRKDIRDRN